MLKLLLASLLGAAVCVGWGMISWMVLQWHDSTLHKFGDEAALAAMIKADAGAVLKIRDQTSGVFMLPGSGMVAGERVATDETRARAQALRKARDDGPYVYAIVRPGPRESSMGANLGFAAARSFAACFIIALMLSWTMHLDYIQRVFFCAIAGLFAGLATDVPMLIWFEAPVRHTLINLADHLCEWFVAGLAVAAIVPGREIWERIR